MAKYDKFNKWLLDQIKDPDLVKRAKERMDMSSLSKEEKSDSGVEPTPRSQKDKDTFEYFHRRSDLLDGYWFHKLYPRGFQEPTEEERQIFEETNRIFENLANFSNMLSYNLRFPGQNLTEEETRFEGVFLSQRSLQRLYNFSRDKVIEFYDPDQLSKDYGAYFKNFTRIFGQEGRRQINALADYLLGQSSPIQDKTYEYYGYTSRGSKRYWWDLDGQVQDHYSLTDKQVKRFRTEPIRRTYVWDVEPLKIRILFLFDQVCDLLELYLHDSEIEWRNVRMKRYIKSSVEGKERIDNPRKYKLMSTILRLCEQEVRSQVPGLSPLKMDEDFEILQRRLPQEIREAIHNFLSSYELPGFGPEDLILIAKQMKKGSKIVKNYFMSYDFTKEEICQVFDALTESQVYQLVNTKDMNWAGDLAYLVFYILLRNTKQSSSLVKTFGQHIHPSQEEVLKEWLKVGRFPEGLEEFSKLWKKDFPHEKGLLQEEESLLERKAWATYLTRVLPLLRKKRYKELNLSFQKIEKSRKNLDETVNLVDSFLDKEEASSKEGLIDEPAGEDEENTALEINPAKIEKVKVEKGYQGAWSLAERDFFKVLIEDGRMDKTKLSQFSSQANKPERVFISDINEKAFDEIGAELLFWEDDFLTMDAYDIPWLEGEIESGNNEE